MHSLKDRRIILIAPDQDLRNAAQRLDQQPAIALRNSLVALQNVVQILEMLQRAAILGLRPADAKPAAAAKHFDRQ